MSFQNLLPFNKRSIENFENHFKAAGLDPIIDFQRVKATGETRKNMVKKMAEMIKDEEPVKDIIQSVKDEMKKNSLPEHDVAVMVRFYLALYSCIFRVWGSKSILYRVTIKRGFSCSRSSLRNFLLHVSTFTYNTYPLKSCQKNTSYVQSCE